MNIRLLISLFLLLSLQGFGQESDSKDSVFVRYADTKSEKLVYKTDTILFNSWMERIMLFGSTVLEGTNRMNYARTKYGYHLNNIISSGCSKGGEIEINGDDQNKIKTIRNLDSLLIIDINVYSNCCNSFLAEIEIVNENTLNLIYTGYGKYMCACDCCFGIEYYIYRDRIFNQKDVEFVMINGDKKTLKKIEKVKK